MLMFEIYIQESIEKNTLCACHEKNKSETKVAWSPKANIEGNSFVIIINGTLMQDKN